MALQISTRDLSSLGSLTSVERTAKSIAILDAILSPEWESRYYSFNAAWNPANNERMASMRNGCGDDYFAVFSPAGAIFKGFAHESLMSPWSTEGSKPWPGILTQVPPVFGSFLAQPAFSIDDITFCIWRTVNDHAWQCGSIEYPEDEDPDGSEQLLSLLDGDPLTYQSFAQHYYEQPVDLSAIRKIYALESLTESLARTLNADLNWEALTQDALEIGYPIFPD